MCFYVPYVFQNVTQRRKDAKKIYVFLCAYVFQNVTQRRKENLCVSN